MKNELAVLNSIKHARTIAKKLDGECKNLALSSFCAANFPGGTLAQVQAVADLVHKREVTLRYYKAVLAAITDMPRGYRALMMAVYVRKTSKSELCHKYGVSLATLYRKLERARKLFAEGLAAQGAGEDWFCTVYNAITTFAATLRKHSFDTAFDTYVQALDGVV